jgi:hypothetical protein
MGKGMKVIIVGLPLFSKRLAQSLSKFDTENSYKHFDTYYSRFDRIKAIWSVQNADCLYSINGTLDKSRLVDIALKKNIPVIMNWVGTDVINALRSYKSGNYQKDYIKGVLHQCEVGWIKEELKEMGIEAEIANFASFEKEFIPVPVLSERLTVLTYIPENRADFYGIDATLRLANKFPNIDFLIVGMEGEAYKSLPNNVQALGWVDDMDETYNRIHICARFPEHDGLSTFILEALARGKKVLYKYAFDHCEHCPDEETLAANLSNLEKLFIDGHQLMNSEGAQFISENFNEKKILGTLVERFNTLSH